MSEDMRSETDGMSARDLRMSLDIDSEATRDQGVGGRHRQSAFSVGGGGYLDNCTISEPPLKGFCKNDPRIDELRRIGLHARWLAVAELIGYEKFVEMWGVLDSSLDEESRKGFTIHRIKELHRFQRNRYIESLSGECSAKDIRARVRDELGEELTVRHISRLMK